MYHSTIYSPYLDVPIILLVRISNPFFDNQKYLIISATILLNACGLDLDRMIRSAEGTASGSHGVLTLKHGTFPLARNKQRHLSRPATRNRKVEAESVKPEQGLPWRASPYDRADQRLPEKA
jgi:hypothetical protein